MRVEVWRVVGWDVGPWLGVPDREVEELVRLVAIEGLRGRRLGDRGAVRGRGVSGCMPWGLLPSQGKGGEAAVLGGDHCVAAST